MKDLFLRLAASAVLALAFACSGDDTPPTPQPSSVTGVAIIGQTPRMVVNDTVTLEALVFPSNAANRGVTWTSADATVAALDSASATRPTLTAKKAGKTTISVKTTEGGFSYSFDMAVVAPEGASIPVTGVTLNKTTMYVDPLGGSDIITAKVWPSNATNPAVVWSSSDTAKATVVGNGPTAMVTGKASGGVTITATTKDGSMTATCAVTVRSYEVPVVQISFAKPTVDVKLDRGTTSVQINVLPPNAVLGQVQYTSSSTSVATVLGNGNKAEVTLLDEGSTMITAKDLKSGKMATCLINVTVPQGGGGGGTVSGGQTISAGPWSSFAISADGSLWAWGYGEAGRLGTGLGEDDEDYEELYPVPVASNATWKFVSAGSYHGAGIQTDGTLWTWGYNHRGMLGLGLGASDLEAAYEPMQVGTDNDWAFVHCGMYHTHAIKTDGTLWGWGSNYYGQLATGNWDSNDHPNPRQLDEAEDWATISSGRYHVVCLKTDGTIWAWGANGYGQIGQGDFRGEYDDMMQVGELDNWKSVEAGYNHCIALNEDGEAWGWGDNYYGQLGTGMWTSGEAEPVQVKPDEAGAFAKVIAGWRCSAGITTEGTIWGWGEGYMGELGTGEDDEYWEPVPIHLYETNFVGISIGYYTGMAIQSNGILWTWGSEYTGHGHDGDDDEWFEPAPLDGIWMP